MTPDGLDVPASPDDLILVGSVAGPFGLRGEIKVFPLSDVPKRLLHLETLYAGPNPDEAVPYAVAGKPRFHRSKGKVLVVLALEGLENIDDAVRLNGRYIYAHASDLPLDEDEVFLHDLVGMAVFSEENEPIGTITDVTVMPAHPVLIVERPDGAQVMIPALPEFVRSVDEEASRIVIAVIEGLLD